MELLRKALKDKKVLVFVDLEGTQISGEMIEIGAYKTYIKDDLSIKKVMPGFKSYVKAKHPIGHVVTRLTGITEEKLKKEGKPFRVVLEDFKNYVGKDWEKCLFVTFGNNDCRIVIQSMMNNLDCNANDAKFMVSKDFDFAKWLSQFIKDQNGNTYSLINYLKLFGKEFEGTAHDALTDAYNLIKLYEAVLNRKDIMEVEYQKSLTLRTSHFPEPVRKAIKALENGKTISPEEYNQYIKDYLK